MPSKKNRNRDKNRNNANPTEDLKEPNFTPQTKAQAKKNDGYRSRY